MNHTRTLLTVHLLISISSIIYAGDVPDQEGAPKITKNDAQDLVRALLASNHLISNVQKTHPDAYKGCRQLDEGGCRRVQEALETRIKKRKEDLVALDRVELAGEILDDCADTSNLMKRIINAEKLLGDNLFQRWLGYKRFAAHATFDDPISLTPSSMRVAWLRSSCKGNYFTGNKGCVNSCSQYSNALRRYLRQEHDEAQKGIQEAIKLAEHAAQTE